MDVFKQLGVPIDEIEFALKISIQTSIISVGVLGNLYTIYKIMHRSKLPDSTNMFIISLSLALILQALNASIDYVNHLNNQEDYVWSLTECDTWHTLNIYLPMLLTLHCFFCLLDRFLLLSRPSVHPVIMNRYTILTMLGATYVLPLFVCVPPVYFQWYTTDKYIRWRTDKECKFVTNTPYALISPLFTFWIPLALVAFIIVKIFTTMAQQDVTVAMTTGGSYEKLQKANQLDQGSRPPWKEDEMRRQHRLAITLWSVYWNVTLFWIPQHAWLFIYKITDADWPRATNFMAWAGYLPCLILPSLYQYYNIYEL